MKKKFKILGLTLASTFLIAGLSAGVSVAISSCGGDSRTAVTIPEASFNNLLWSIYEIKTNVTETEIQNIFKNYYNTVDNAYNFNVVKDNEKITVSFANDKYKFANEDWSQKPNLIDGSIVEGITCEDNNTKVVIKGNFSSSVEETLRKSLNRYKWFNKDVAKNIFIDFQDYLNESPNIYSADQIKQSNLLEKKNVIFKLLNNTLKQKDITNEVLKYFDFSSSAPLSSTNGKGGLEFSVTLKRGLMFKNLDDQGNPQKEVTTDNNLKISISEDKKTLTFSKFDFKTKEIDSKTIEDAINNIDKTYINPKIPAAGEPSDKYYPLTSTILPNMAENLQDSLLSKFGNMSTSAVETNNEGLPLLTAANNVITTNPNSENQIQKTDFTKTGTITIDLSKLNISLKDTNKIPVKSPIQSITDKKIVLNVTWKVDPFKVNVVNNKLSQKVSDFLIKNAVKDINGLKALQNIDSFFKIVNTVEYDQEGNPSGNIKTPITNNDVEFVTEFAKDPAKPMGPENTQTIKPNQIAIKIKDNINYKFTVTNQVSSAEVLSDGRVLVINNVFWFGQNAPIYTQPAAGNVTLESRIQQVINELKITSPNNIEYYVNNQDFFGKVFKDNPFTNTLNKNQASVRANGNKLTIEINSGATGTNNNQLVFEKPNGTQSLSETFNVTWFNLSVIPTQTDNFVDNTQKFVNNNKINKDTNLESIKTQFVDAVFGAYNKEGSKIFNDDLDVNLKMTSTSWPYDKAQIIFSAKPGVSISFVNPATTIPGLSIVEGNKLAIDVNLVSPQITINTTKITSIIQEYINANNINNIGKLTNDLLTDKGYSNLIDQIYRSGSYSSLLTFDEFNQFFKEVNNKIIITSVGNKIKLQLQSSSNVIFDNNSQEFITGELTFKS